MTLLNWELSSERVLILSDTLSLNGESRLPQNFMTKIYPVPHLGGVITGTGLRDVVAKFFLATNGAVIARNLEHLSQFAPNMLRQLWDEVVEDLPSGITVTIYTFGLMENGEFGGFAYRSTNDFDVEVLEQGMAFKPAPDIDALPPMQSLEDLVQLAHQQQKEDRAQKRLQRVGVGGDLWLYLLSKSEDGSLNMTTTRVERLRYSDHDFKLILAGMPVNQSHPYSKALIAKALED